MYTNLSFEPTRGIFYILLALSLTVFSYLYYTRYIKNTKLSLTSEKEIPYLLLILFSGLLLRFIIAALSGGLRSDINTNISWANTAARDLFGFYDNKNMFIDYPPGAISIFYFIGALARYLNISTSSSAYVFLIKLPGILADVISTVLIYKIAQKKLPSKYRLWVVALYYFNPSILLNASDYGQVDSLLVMFILAALYYIMTDRVNKSAIFFAIALLVKPQSLFLFPILFFELLRKKDIMNFVKSFLYGLGTTIIILLPFSIGKSPFWIFEFYKKGADVYQYATINAFNLFALFGANWEPDKNILFLFSYNTWGNILSIALLISVTALYFLSKNKNTMYAFYTALILNVGVFMFFARIKERYIFPAVAFALVAFIVSLDRRTFALFVGFSITSFINTFMLYSRALATDFKDFWIPPHHPMLIIISIVNLLLFGYLMKVTYDIFVKGNIVKVNLYETSLDFKKRKKRQK